MLIAAPWPGETAMHDDLNAMREALRTRGYRTNEIQVLEGTLTRSRVLALLDSASRQVASWKSGSVFLYYTGHGSPTSSDEQSAQAALQFEEGLPEASNRESWLSWADVFADLKRPEGVELVLLPDS